MLIRDVGEKSAKDFLDAHEAIGIQSIQEKEMDIFNNTKGMRAALEMQKQQAGFENQELFDRASKEIIKGGLKILNKR